MIKPPPPIGGSLLEPAAIVADTSSRFRSSLEVITRWPSPTSPTRSPVAVPTLPDITAPGDPKGPAAGAERLANVGLLQRVRRAGAGQGWRTRLPGQVVYPPSAASGSRGTGRLASWGSPGGSACEAAAAVQTTRSRPGCGTTHSVALPRRRWYVHGGVDPGPLGRICPIAPRFNGASASRRGPSIPLERAAEPEGGIAWVPACGCWTGKGGRSMDMVPSGCEQSTSAGSRRGGRTVSAPPHYLDVTQPIGVLTYLPNPTGEAACQTV